MERCVVPGDAPVAIDAAPLDAAVDLTDAAPVLQTISIAAECDGSRCTGGYDGVKNQSGPPNATKLCMIHGFPKSNDYTIESQQPGGRFCTYNPATASFGCDPSCSGCNAIATVTCSIP